MTKEFAIPEGTEEERAMYLKLAKKFGLRVAKVIEPIPGVVKIIKGESYCSLCETTTEQYIVMDKYTDGIWRKNKTVTKEEASKIPCVVSLHRDSVSCCENCIDFLMSKDKMDLVKMLMQSRSPVLINKAVKKVLKDMREKKDG